MNKAQIGLHNEEDLIHYLNGKRLAVLNEKWKQHISAMFPFIVPEDVIYARKFPDHKAKPDIIIRVRHTCVYVSVKSGKNPSIHQEDFFAFSRFLSRNSVDKRTLRIIQFYHFGETKKLNNNGVPFTREELQEQFSEYILWANNQLNRLSLIDAVINRAVIRGADSRRTAIDYLYYGSLQEGILLSREEIFTSVRQIIDHQDRPIHFGALNYQPAGRKRTSIDYRYVRIKWPLLAVMFYENKNKK